VEPIANSASKLEAKGTAYIKENRLPGAAVGVVHGDRLPHGA
jgi:hypothetical protein